MIETLLFWFSVYGVPVALAIFSVIAVKVWEPQYGGSEGADLPFRVLQMPTDLVEPRDAAMVLARALPAVSLDTNRSEAPFWLIFQPGSAADAGQPAVIEFPSRHANRMACWRGPDWMELGTASRKQVTGALRAGKSGFILDTADVDANAEILCSATFIGPARLTIKHWSPSSFQLSELAFNYDHGMLTGGMLILLVFVLLTAAINRQVIYVTFAAWLAINLRLAALSVGWDIYWLGHAIPPEYVLLLRQLGIATYYILGVALFTQLFRQDTQRIDNAAWLRGIQWSCVPLLTAAVALPYASFLPIMWVMSATTVTILNVLLIRIVLVIRSTVAVLFGLSIAIALLASLSEVLGAAFGLKGLVGSLNHVTAALASSVMVTLAIAEQMRLERVGKQKAELALRNAYEAIPIGLFSLDLNGQITQGNPALRALLSIRTTRHLGHWKDHLPIESFNKLREAVTVDGTCDMEIHCELHMREVWLTLRAKLAHSAIEGSIQDVTERRKATERLQFLADHDSVTATLNRRGLEERMAQALDSGQAVSVAFLDLARFTLVNDLYGHAAGDEVLKQVCQRISACLEDMAFLGRMGGDKFVVVFSRGSVDAATAVCRRTIASIEDSPFRIGGTAFRLRVSIGLIETPAGISVADAISSAEQACRQAKKNHGVEPLVFRREAAIFQDRAAELQLVKKFDGNTATDGLLLMMQPIMSLSAPHASLDFETLLRMRTADGRIVSADKILLAAENNGRIAVIDRWVLQRLLEWLDGQLDRLGNTRFVCMNLSGGSLNDERFIADACSMLAGNERVARRLCIEITEGVALRDYGNTKQFIDRVRDHGVRIALDDFGAGYTSFSYLRHLPADVLKIDGDFVRDAHRSPINLGIVETIADLARNLGMKTIAEWTETLASVKAMAEVGIDYVQGYAIARPMLPEEILAASSCGDFVTDLETRNFLEFLAKNPDDAIPGRSADKLGWRGFH